MQKQFNIDVVLLFLPSSDWSSVKVVQDRREDRTGVRTQILVLNMQYCVQNNNKLT